LLEWGLYLKPCILTLLLVYPFFLLAGVACFRYCKRHYPHKDPKRNELLTFLRFALYVVLMPLGALLAAAILGWLDPVYHLVRRGL
jgi:hypothetical protein